MAIDHAGFAGSDAQTYQYRLSRKDEEKNVMISESRIYRSAQVLIAQHQESAFSEAMVQMDRYWLADNEEEMNVWRWIANTIHMIQMSSRCAGHTVH